MANNEWWQAEMQHESNNIAKAMAKHDAMLEQQQVVATQNATRKRKANASKKATANRWDIDLSQKPTKVVIVTDYFKSSVTDSIHKIATTVEKTKKAVKSANNRLPYGYTTSKDPNSAYYGLVVRTNGW